MGLTPLEVLHMGTRSGDIDPQSREFIAKKENLDIEGVMNVLNKKSGCTGIYRYFFLISVTLRQLIVTRWGNNMTRDRSILATVLQNTSVP